MHNKNQKKGLTQAFAALIIVIVWTLVSLSIRSSATSAMAQSQQTGGGTGAAATGEGSAPSGAAPANASASSITRTLAQGMSGSDVTFLQQLLMKDGVYAGPITGYFGPLTQAGVEAFQHKHGIVSQGTPGTTGYGLVGPKTRGELNGL